MSSNVERGFAHCVCGGGGIDSAKMSLELSTSSSFSISVSKSLSLSNVSKEQLVASVSDITSRSENGWDKSLGDSDEIDDMDDRSILLITIFGGLGVDPLVDMKDIFFACEPVFVFVFGAGFAMVLGVIFLVDNKVSLLNSSQNIKNKRYN